LPKRTVVTVSRHQIPGFHVNSKFCMRGAYSGWCIFLLPLTLTRFKREREDGRRNQNWRGETWVGVVFHGISLKEATSETMGRR
jgi:hypothetical protein